VHCRLRLVEASLLISSYSVRSERAFCEDLDCQLLWRRLLDMSLMDPTFDQSTFSTNVLTPAGMVARSHAAPAGGRATPDRGLPGAV